jgi:hypothetical protein
MGHTLAVYGAGKTTVETSFRIAGEPGATHEEIGMAKQGSPASGAKTPAGRSDQNAAGGSAGIEIVGSPQMLYTRTFGDPDTLFVPLLDAARDANKMLVRLIGLGEERGNAVTLSGMQLTSSLLRGGNLPTLHTNNSPAHEAGFLSICDRLLRRRALQSKRAAVDGPESHN